MVEIDCEKSMKLETSRNVTKSKRSLHWCRSISKKYLCTFYYSISQKVITLSGRRFITVSGGFITLSGSYYSIGRFYYIIGQLLQYRAFITLSVGTAVAQWLVRATDEQIPIEWSLLRIPPTTQCECRRFETCKFVYPTFPVFRMRHNKLLVPSVWCSWRGK